VAEAVRRLLDEGENRGRRRGKPGIFREVFRRELARRTTKENRSSERSRNILAIFNKRTIIFYT